MLSSVVTQCSDTECLIIVLPEHVGYHQDPYPLPLPLACHPNVSPKIKVHDHDMQHQCPKKIEKLAILLAYIHSSPVVIYEDYEYNII